MPETDEDANPSLSSPHANRPVSEEVDDDELSDGDSDAAPDYRFLQSTTTAKKHALPARGEKDFEPNPTQKQISTLDESRKAMADALGVVRVHTISTGKNGGHEMVGIYFSEEEDWDGGAWHLEEQQHKAFGMPATLDAQTKQKKPKTGAMRKGEGRCVAVEKFTSTLGRTMGVSDGMNWSWLLPEEALFLLERGTLDIRYAVDEDDEAAQDHLGPIKSTSGDQDEVQQNNLDNGAGLRLENQEYPSDDMQLFGGGDQPPNPKSNENPLIPPLKIGTIPLSLQGAYAAFVGNSKSELTLERYVVFANLRRAGYIVQRAPTWRGERVPSAQISAAQYGLSSQQRTPISRWNPFTLIRRLFSFLFSRQPRPFSIPCHNLPLGPLISPGIFRSYGDIFRQLQVIPQHGRSSFTLVSSFDHAPQDDQNFTSVTKSSEPPLLPTYHIWKPSALAGYKKSSPPKPDYTIVVLDSRDCTISTSTQIGQLLDSMPDDFPADMARKRLETRIKHGKRNVLLAVVDSGLVSYMRISDSGFSEGNVLWEENEKRGKVARGGKRGGGWRGHGRGGGGRGRGS